MSEVLYSCSNCDFKTDNISKFLAHCKFHRNQPNLTYKCPLVNCIQTFTAFMSLKVHISRNHSILSNRSMNQLDHPFIEDVSNHCKRPECLNRSFDSYSNLKKHLKQHLIKKEEIACPFIDCPSKFRLKSSFTSHLSRKHRTPSNHNLFHSRQLDASGEQLFGDSGERDDQVDENLGDIVNESEYDDSFINEEQFLQKISLFYLKLKGKYLLPSSVIQSIITEMQECHDISQVMLWNKLNAKLESHGIIPEIISEVKNEFCVHDVFSNCNNGPLKTPARRSSFYHKNLAFCDPVEAFLGLDSQQRRKTYQYVPICHSLTSLFKHYGSHFKFFNNVNITENISTLCDVSDGSIFKRNKLLTDSKCFAIILYQDAFEVVNPLGSAKKKHKMVAVYYTLANFEAYKRSNIDHMQLVLLCQEKSLKTFSVKRVFERLVCDLKILEQNGIEVNGEIIKGSLVCICGDNLGSHTIGGFNESFSSHFFCRYCEIDRRETPLQSRSCPRTNDNYNNAVEMCISENRDSFKGIKSKSPFNDLGFYHVVSGLPPCLGHDLFEGVVSYDMMLIINYFISLKWFSCAQLNQRIQAWPYDGIDKLDTPAPIVVTSEKLGGHAIQNWVFARLFCFFIFNFIKDSNDRVWQMYLNLKSIIEILTSNSITHEQIAYVNVCIEEYLFDRHSLFENKPLKPKHHFLLHYPELTMTFGPLIHLWTMRFESKHTYFKTCARRLHNFKHLAKTLASRHQVLQAFYTSGSLFKPSIICEKGFSLNTAMYNEYLKQLFQSEHMSSNNTEVHGSVLYRNIEYKVGYIVLVSGEAYSELTLGKIDMVLVKDGGLYLIVLESPYCFVPENGVYQQMSCQIKYSCISVPVLKCSQPVTVYKTNGINSLSLKSLHN